ncbi:MAG: bifunctional 4-hydroxy-2-oxoglutarate aldolase/2-dehydro-3-deoxy-phosphogluconate aldolase [Planctomycetes bacterium]|nr:bifunctional 4-hydroxy-2-oxoglutarate aldolase/2-dehydro-3-deoxy-phosphogluconate aldolase [Planctomycetota bacterium]
MKLIPIMTIQDAADAPAAAEALQAGGLPCAEVTLRTAAAPEAIRTIATRSDMLVGAGTVLSVDQAKQAVDCGATFLVAPGTNPAVVQWAADHHVPITPGVATPTDIDRAISLGLDVLKFFPAHVYGGPKAIKALGAPYGSIRFIPAGGVDADNLAEYLAMANVLACGGSWMVRADLIADRRLDRITALTRHAVTIAAHAAAPGRPGEHAAAGQKASKTTDGGGGSTPD